MLGVADLPINSPFLPLLEYLPYWYFSAHFESQQMILLPCNWVAQAGTLNIVKNVFLPMTTSPIVFSLTKYMDDQLEVSFEFKT